MPGRIKKIFMAMVFFAAAALSVPVHAAEASFSLDIESLNLQTGVGAQMVLTTVNAPGASVAGMEGIEEFDVYSQTRSTSTTISGGETIVREEIYYSIVPRRAGTFTLIAYIEFEGEFYVTDALVINVSDEAVSGGNPELFLRTILSDDEPFLGEKIVLTYELYSRVNIQDYGFTEYIAIDGVVAYETPDDRLEAEYVYLDGERYVRYEARQFIIDPIKPGVYVIPSFTMQVNVLQQGGRQGAFGGFGGFLQMTRPAYIQSTEITLNVRPLPGEGRPADFTGVIGDFTLSGEFSRTSMNYGDSFSLRVRASGHANLDSLKSIIGSAPGFTVYETQKNFTERVDGGRYYAEKEFEIIFVPEKTGELNIEQIEIPFFNPESLQYERAIIDGAVIEILGEMPVYSPGGYSIETVSVSQVSYNAPDGDYYTVRLKKDVLIAVLAGTASVIIITGVIAAFLIFRKKRDPEFTALYKKLSASRDFNETYGLMNEMIKRRCGVSIKASPISAVRNAISDNNLADKVAEIIDFAESPEARAENGNAEMIKKAKGVYVILKKN